MTGQSRSMNEILKDRLRATQDIAEANMEQLRLNQKASGMMVLDMKDERDGIADSAHETAQARNDAALEANVDRIGRLEARLSALDEELEAAIKEQG
ncbi:hypothetical protein [Marivita sp.]|uniref:hypothetical protein n=1 Tax=Marivita sp. TaxID=2003365 RepID=UPI0026204BB8|nr:hypothetical protein [Marivita sp.]